MYSQAELQSAVASPARLFAGTLIDGVVVIVASPVLFDVLSASWERLSGAPVVAPVIAFMGSYSAPAQNGYWLIVLLSIVVAILVAVVGSTFLGASAGKALLGVRFLDSMGKRTSIAKVFLKSLLNICLFAALALPGPILGFTFGNDANAYSLIALIVASIFVIRLSFNTDASRRVAVYRWSGIYPVVSKNLPDRKPL